MYVKKICCSIVHFINLSTTFIVNRCLFSSHLAATWQSIYHMYFFVNVVDWVLSPSTFVTKPIRIRSFWIVLRYIKVWAFLLLSLGGISLKYEIKVRWLHRNIQRLFYILRWNIKSLFYSTHPSRQRMNRESQTKITKTLTNLDVRIRYANYNHPLLFSK